MSNKNLEKNKEEIKEEVLAIWDHAGLDNEVDARTLAKKLNKEPDLSKSGSRSGRQLQHPQIGNSFGRDGVLGAMSKNIEGISLKDLATKNNIATKKISAGLITRIVFSIIGSNSTKALYFPVMWKPIINYFLGKLFGDSKITEKEYQKGIKQITINEGTVTTYNIKQQLIQEGVVDHMRNNWKKYAVDASLIGTGVLMLNGDVGEAIDKGKAYGGYAYERSNGDLSDTLTGIGRGIQDGYTTPSVIDQGIQSAQAQTTAENIAHDQHLKNLNVENPQFIQKIASDLSGNIEQAVKSDGAVMDRKIYK